MSKSVSKVLISTIALLTGLSAIAYANFVYTFNSVETPTEVEQPDVIKKLEGKGFLAYIESVKED